MPQSEWWRLDLMSFTHATPPPFFDFLPVSLYLSISSSPVLNSVSGASCYCWWKWLRSRVPPVHLQQGWCTGNCDNSNLPATRWDIWANLKRLIFVLRQHKMTLSCTKPPPPPHPFLIVFLLCIHAREIHFAVFFGFCVLKQSSSNVLKEAAFVLFYYLTSLIKNSHAML